VSWRSEGGRATASGRGGRARVGPDRGAVRGVLCLLTALLGTLVLTARPAGAQDGLGLLDRAAERYGAVESLCADFAQTLRVPLLGQERSGTGRLCQQAPDRFAMRFQDPAEDAVVVDGTSVWLYYPSTDPRQVIKLPMRELPGGFDFHRAFLQDPAGKYEVSYQGRESVAGHATHRLGLKPRDPAAYQEAEVWIDAAEPVLRQARVTEENGSVRTVTLTGVEFGAQAPAGFFEFTPPDGAQVIER